METKYLVLRAKRSEDAIGLKALSGRGQGAPWRFDMDVQRAERALGRRLLEGRNRLPFKGTAPSRLEMDGLDIETFDGRERDAEDLRRDPQNVAIADAESVFSLVAPNARSAANLAELKEAGAQRLPHGLIAVGAHTTGFTGQGVTVAVLDTGIDTKHPAFAGKEIVTRDFTGEGKDERDVSDRDGHGTHCAGTICGVPVGDVRVGVAPGVNKLCVAKVLGRRGGTAEMFLKAMHWAVVEQKAAVVSLSLGYDLPGNVQRYVDRGLELAIASSLVLRQHADLIRCIGALKAYLEAVSPNVVLVAATGNESARPKVVLDAALPASELIGIGAVGMQSSAEKWSVAPFSNGRARLVAPGVDVLSCAPGGGWVIMSGTSMATPHAAGVAATWHERLRNEGGLVLQGAVRGSMEAAATRQPVHDEDQTAVGAGLVQCPH